MGISFWGSKKSSTPSTSSHPTPHTPEPRKFGNYEGNVTHREAEIANNHLRRQGLNSRERATIGEIISASVNEKGSQRGANAGELNQSFDDMVEDSSKLRISKEHIEIARKEYESKL